MVLFQRKFYLKKWTQKLEDKYETAGAGTRETCRGRHVLDLRNHVRWVNI